MVCTIKEAPELGRFNPIHDGNYLQYADDPTTRGVRGLRPRDYDRHPFGSMPFSSRLPWPEIPEHEWRDRIAEGHAKKTFPIYHSLRRKLPRLNQKSLPYCWQYAPVGALQTTQAMTSNRETVYLSATSAGGPGSYVDLPNDSALDVEYVTLSCFVKIAPTGTGGGLVGRYAPGAVSGYRLVLAPTPYMTVVTDGTGFEQVTDGVAPAVSSIYHFCGTYDGSTIKLYKNGVLVASTACTGAILDAGDNGSIGYDAGGLEYSEGSIWDVRIYGSALTASEVLYIATKGNSGTAPSVDPVGHWTCSEGKGNIIHDVSPNANHGLLTNANLVDARAVKQPEFAWNEHYGYSDYENLFPNSEPTSGGTADNMTVGAADSEFVSKLGVVGMITNPTGSTLNYHYRTLDLADEYVYCECVVKMDDASQPSYGSGVTDDLIFIAGGGVMLYTPTFTDLGDDFWKIEIEGVCSDATSFCGLIQYAGQSGKGFRASKVRFARNRSSYIYTNGTAVPFSFQPARTDGLLDALGNEITRPAGEWHNLSESTVDFTGGVAAPKKDWSRPINLFTSPLDYYAYLGNNGNVQYGKSDPFGTNLAIEYLHTTTNSSESGIRINSVGLEASTTYSISVYAKSVTERFVLIRILAYGGSGGTLADEIAWFDLESGSLGTLGSNLDSSRMTNVGGGWYRCEVKFTTTGTISADIIDIRASDSDAAYGHTSGDSVQLAGLQLVANDVVGEFTPHDWSDYGPTDFHPAPSELLNFNSEFGNAYWSEVHSTVSINTSTAPDGSVTADKIVEDAGADRYPYIQPALVSGFVTGDTYRFSVDAKAAGRNYIWLQGHSVSFAKCFYDLSAGVVIQNGTNMSGTIESLGSGWYRCSYIMKVEAGTTDSYVAIGIGLGVAYAGDGTSGVYLANASIKRYFAKNPLFYRLTTQDGHRIKADRVVRYSQVLTGSRLTAAEKFTLDRTL